MTASANGQNISRNWGWCKVCFCKQAVIEGIYSSNPESWSCFNYSSIFLKALSKIEVIWYWVIDLAGCCAIRWSISFNYVLIFRGLLIALSNGCNLWLLWGSNVSTMILCCLQYEVPWRPMWLLIIQWPVAQDCYQMVQYSPWNDTATAKYKSVLINPKSDDDIGWAWAYTTNWSSIHEKDELFRGKINAGGT